MIICLIVLSEREILEEEKTRDAKAESSSGGQLSAIPLDGAMSPTSACNFARNRKGDNKLHASKSWLNEFASHGFPTPEPARLKAMTIGARLLGTEIHPKAGKEKKLVPREETLLMEPEVMF